MVHNLARLEELRGELQDTAEKIAEQVYETDEDFQRYVPNELNKAATCLQNISNVLAAHTTGHGYISSEVCQKSKDSLLTTREEASCLPGPTARVEVSYYNTRGTCRKETSPIFAIGQPMSIKQHQAEHNKFQHVQEDVEPTRFPHISNTTKHQNGKITGRSHDHNVGLEDFSFRSKGTAKPLPKKGTEKRQAPMQNLEWNKPQSILFPPIFPEKTSAASHSHFSNNRFKAGDKVYPTTYTEEFGTDQAAALPPSTYFSRGNICSSLLSSF